MTIELNTKHLTEVDIGRIVPFVCPYCFVEFKGAVAHNLHTDNPDENCNYWRQWFSHQLAIASMIH